MGLRSGLCAGQSSSSATNSFNHLYGHCFVHWCKVMLEQKRSKNVLVKILLASSKPSLAHQAAKQRSMICHSTEHVSTAPESSSCMLYTNPFDVWHCTRCYEACMQLCVRGNPCSQKFPLHSFHGDINTSGSSDLFTVAMDSFSRLFGDFCSLYASSLSDPVLWFHAVFCFMAELLLFPNAYTFRQHHLQLIVLSSRVEIS